MMDWYGNGMGAGGWVAMILAMAIFWGRSPLCVVHISCLASITSWSARTLSEHGPARFVLLAVYVAAHEAFVEDLQRAAALAAVATAAKIITPARMTRRAWRDEAT